MKASELHGKPSGEAEQPPQQDTGDRLQQWKIRKARESAIANRIETVVGNFPPVRVGQPFLFRGSWVEDARFGWQLSARELQEQELTHEVDLVAYLRAGVCLRPARLCMLVHACSGIQAGIVLTTALFCSAATHLALSRLYG